VSQHSRSKNWDTRVAAAHAIGAIAENVKHTSSKDLFTSVETEKQASGLSYGTDDAASALPCADATATSDLAFKRFCWNYLLIFHNAK
jgi:TATA-binding protein-associated factor